MNSDIFAAACDISSLYISTLNHLQNDDPASRKDEQ